MGSKEILKDFKLKTTSCRSEVLEVLIKNGHALSHSEIEAHIDPTFDRVTVYRTLKTFLENGLVHKVLDDGGLSKYALCSECTKDDHHHEHVHFKCQDCGHTRCIDEIKVPTISLPVGYSITETNLLVMGICNHCNERVSGVDN